MISTGTTLPIPYTTQILPFKVNQQNTNQVDSLISMDIIYPITVTKYVTGS